MAVRKSKKATVTVTSKTVVATPDVAKAVATVADARLSKKQLTLKEDASKGVVLDAVAWDGSEPSILVIDPEGEILAEVLTVKGAESVSFDKFVETLRDAFPLAWKALMDADPHAFEAAKRAATKSNADYPRVLTK